METPNVTKILYLPIVGLCLAQPPDLSSLNVAHVQLGQSGLVFRCGVGRGGIVVGALGGGVEFSVARPVRLLLFVPWVSLPSVASRWWSEPSLDHQGALASLAFRVVSCSYGPFVPMGGMCRPGCLVAGEGTEGCRVQRFRRVASRVHIYHTLITVAVVFINIW